MAENDFLKSYRVRITPLSPVHVGSGEVLEPYQYALKGHELWVFDLSKLIDILPDTEAGDYLRAVERGPFEARKKLSQLVERYDLEPATIWRAPVAPGFRDFLSQALRRGTGELGIRLFPSALEGPYLPGSSLKGAIRTTVLFDASRNKLKAEFNDDSLKWVGKRDYIWQQQGRRLSQGRWYLEDRGNGRIRPPFALKRPRRGEKREALPINQAYEATVLDVPFSKNGKPVIHGDPFRALAVSDSSPLPATQFHLVEVYGSRKNPSGPTGIVQLAQVWSEGSVEANLRFHTGQLNHSNSAIRSSAQALKGELATLAKSAYERLINLADAELYEYDQRGWNKAARAMEHILDTIEGCLNEDGTLKKPYRFPLRMGYGSSELSMRLSEFIEYTTRKGSIRLNPISRKLSEGLPMGWVMVEVLE
ncbi:MAG: type III-A CRISPR-associated RAMP protein Csm5 [Candidatus Diapherotrites archaeon]|nr:type III-A CRISPR-associated RAMP protein Csm5 [Candidatus Diapherotrites archaeon]